MHSTKAENAVRLASEKAKRHKGDCEHTEAARAVEMQSLNTG